MALFSEVSSTHTRKYDVDGQDEPSRGTPAPMSMRVDGDIIELSLVGSQHVGACLAALCAMADADARGVTHIELRTNSKLLRNHATGHWRQYASLLKSLHEGIEAVSKRFEDVSWT